MNAAALAAALGDARREGRTWRCRCPLHGGRSLVLRDGEGNRVLAMCWDGCDRLDVLAELERRGLIDKRAHYAPPVVSASRGHEEGSRTIRALKIWHGATDGANAIPHCYLARRGITLDSWLRSLRFHPRCPRPRDDAGNFASPMQ